MLSVASKHLSKDILTQISRQQQTYSAVPTDSSQYSWAALRELFVFWMLIKYVNIELKFVS